MPLDQYLIPHKGAYFRPGHIVFNHFLHSLLDRKKISKSLQYTMEIIVLNLFKARAIHPAMTVGIMRKKSYWDGRNKSYVNPRLSYRNIINSLDYLLASGWIVEVQKGQ